ncbi:MAG: hypothetical protein ABIG84_04255 [archaeon]
MDWTACVNKSLAKKAKTDTNLLISLKKSSAKKLESERLLVLNDTTAASKVSLAYDALREILESLAIKNGYKIYNHECYTAFLKEIMNESAIADKYDRFRKIRNAINYYGKDITPGEAEPVLAEIRELVEKINSLLV